MRLAWLGAVFLLLACRGHAASSCTAVLSFVCPSGVIQMTVGSQTNFPCTYSASTVPTFTAIESPGTGIAVTFVSVTTNSMTVELATNAGSTLGIQTMTFTDSTGKCTASVTVNVFCPSNTYTLNSACVQCPNQPNCESCTSATTCTQCAVGYGGALCNTCLPGYAGPTCSCATGYSGYPNCACTPSISCSAPSALLIQGGPPVSFTCTTDLSTTNLIITNSSGTGLSGITTSTSSPFLVFVRATNGATAGTLQIATSGCITSSTQLSIIANVCASACTACIGNNVCAACQPGFAAPTCTACGLTYYASGSSCLPCSSNCQTCGSNANCTLCSFGYDLVNGACVQDCTITCATPISLLGGSSSQPFACTTTSLVITGLTFQQTAGNGISSTFTGSIPLFDVTLSATPSATSGVITITPTGCSVTPNAALVTVYVCASGCQTCSSPTVCTSCILPNTYGSACDVTCVAATTCSGNGVCQSDGTCACIGRATGLSCNVCPTGYTGPDCTQCVTGYGQISVGQPCIFETGSLIVDCYPPNVAIIQGQITTQTCSLDWSGCPSGSSYELNLSNFPADIIYDFNALQVETPLAVTQSVTTFILTIISSSTTSAMSSNFVMTATPGSLICNSVSTPTIPIAVYCATPIGCAVCPTSSTCTSCQPGFYLNTVTSTCSVCPSNTFSSAGSTSCSPCPVGSTSQQGSANCITSCATSLNVPSNCQTCSGNSILQSASASCPGLLESYAMTTTGTYGLVLSTSTLGALDGSFLISNYEAAYEFCSAVVLGDMKCSQGVQLNNVPCYPFYSYSSIAAAYLPISSDMVADLDYTISVWIHSDTGSFQVTWSNNYAANVGSPLSCLFTNTSGTCHFYNSDVVIPPIPQGVDVLLVLSEINFPVNAGTCSNWFVYYNGVSQVATSCTPQTRSLTLPATSYVTVSYIIPSQTVWSGVVSYLSFFARQFTANEIYLLQTCQDVPYTGTIGAPGQLCNNADQTCVACPSNCVVCSGTGTCITCDVGYIGATCSQCDTNHGYHLFEGMCIDCLYGGPDSVDGCICDVGYEPIPSSFACVECSPETYKPVVSNEPCIPCPNGCTTCESSGGQCLSCSADYYLNANEHTCLPCSEYSGMEGCATCSSSVTCQIQHPCVTTFECLSCETGFYMSNGACATCDPSCDSGCTDGSPCLTCGLGNYLGNAGGVAACIPCPAGTFDPNTVSISVTDCQNCPENQYALSNSSTCTPCPAGCPQDCDSTSANCFSCTDGYALDTTQYPYTCVLCRDAISGCTSCSSTTACNRCELGYYLTAYDPNSPSTCIPCSNFSTNCAECNNNYNPETGLQSPVCTGCAEPLLVTPTGTCATSCPPGSNLDDSAGAVSSDPGPAHFIEPATPVPSPAPGPGSNSGSTPPHQFYSSDSSATQFPTCIECGSGLVSAGDGASCDPCPYGQYTIDHITCPTCPSGTISNGTVAYSGDGLYTLTAYYTPSVAGQPLGGIGLTFIPESIGFACADGVTDATGTLVIACDLMDPFTGQIFALYPYTVTASVDQPGCPSNSLPDEIVQACPNDMFNVNSTNPPVLSCVSCPTTVLSIEPPFPPASIYATDGCNANGMAGGGFNFVQFSTGFSYNPLPASYDPSSISAIWFTGPFTFVPGCGYLMNDQTSTSPFPFFAHLNYSTCADIAIPLLVSDCAAGQYSDNTTTTDCLSCDGGSTSNAYASTCFQCNAGSYLPSPGASCTICAPGSASNSPGLTTCPSCIAGSYSTGNATTCTLCSIGSYNNTQGATACANCAANTYQPNIGQTTCIACASGSQSGVGSSQCAGCPTGQYLVPGTTTCSNCLANQIPDPTGISCDPCGPASFSNPGDASCTSCPPGTAALNVGNQPNTCFPCPAGSVASGVGNVACVECSGYTYQPQGGQASCLTCPGNSIDISNDGTSCVCPLGFLLGNPSSCQPCPAGSYGDSTSSTGCSPCPSGTSNSTPGVIGVASCTLCNPGYYAPILAPGATVGATSCSYCGSLGYTNTQGQSTCTPCTNGAAAPGSTSCVCNSGYAATDGSNICTACRPGTNSTGGTTACTTCPTTYYQPSSGASVCQACPLGSVTNLAQTTCTACPAGQYASTATACTLCAPGSHSDSPGQSTCVLCQEGTFSDMTGLIGSCQQCETGDYQPEDGQTVCLSCGVGTYSSMQGMPQCSVCSSGTISNTTDSTDCISCNTGTYQSGSDFTECFACSAGTYTPNDGNTYTACITCTAGTFQSSEGQDSCTACPQGKFSNSDASACTPCPQFKVAVGSDASECVYCPPGGEANPTGTGCQPCLQGTFNPNANGIYSCTNCSVGTSFGGIGATACFTCGRGFYAPTTGSANCPACPPGSISSIVNASACTPCTGNTYAQTSTSCGTCMASSFPAQYEPTAIGNDVCACQNGYYGAPVCNDQCGFYLGTPACGFFCVEGDQPFCTPCPPGTNFTAVGVEPGTQLSSCGACPTGLASLTGSATCSPCLGNTYNSGGVCVSCPTNSSPVSGSPSNTGCQCNPGFAGIGIQGCMPCAIGTYSATSGLTVCLSCAAGTYSASAQSTTCLSCASNSVSNAANGGCVTCNAGYAPDSAQSSCQQCAAGHYSLAKSSACSACAAGSISIQTGASTCSLCVAGYNQSWTGQSSCASCMPGTYTATSGQLQCTQCAAGSYQGASASTTCSICPSGQSSLADSSDCTSCSPSLYAPSDSAICQPCGAGQIPDPTRSFCQPCAPGSFSSSITGVSACSLCAAGTFTNSAGSLSCTICGVGKYAVAGSSFCSSCIPGTYEPNSQSPSCLNCPAGNTSASSATSCFACATGSVAVSGAPSCTMCTAGSYSDVNQDACLSCGPGTYSNMSAQTTCKNCAIGYYQSGSGVSACTGCSPGQISTVVGSASCTNCAAGFSSSGSGSTCTQCTPGTNASIAGSPSCAPCAAGTFSGPGALYCISCSLGQYWSVSAYACVTCPVGTFSTLSGNSACTQCSPGTYQPGFASVRGGPAGPTACASCSPGSYSNQFAAAACTNCALGYDQPNSGSTSCGSCAAGSYAGATGLSVCTQCTASNAYAPSTGSTACLTCPSGTVSTVTPHTSCGCGAGFYSNQQGGCTPCPIGTYSGSQSATSAAACVACPTGTYGPTTGLNQCPVCPTGSYTSKPKSTSCIKCATNAISSPDGTQCLCQAGWFGNGYKSCKQCGPGSYTPVPNQLNECYLCPAGSSSLVAATSCTLCPANDFQPLPGFHYCFTCSPGCLSDAGSEYCYQSGTPDPNNVKIPESCSEPNVAIDTQVATAIGPGKLSLPTVSAVPVSVVSGQSITISGNMQGSLTITAGTTSLYAGYTLSIPTIPAGETMTVVVTNPTVTYSCKCGSTTLPFVIGMSTQTYTLTNSQWYPSATISNAATYQGGPIIIPSTFCSTRSIQVPSATFTATVTSDSDVPIEFKFHYGTSAQISAGTAWSSVGTLTPAPAPTQYVYEWWFSPNNQPAQIVEFTTVSITYTVQCGLSSPGTAAHLKTQASVVPPPSSTVTVVQNLPNIVFEVGANSNSVTVITNSIDLGTGTLCSASQPQGPITNAFFQAVVSSSNPNSMISVFFNITNAPEFNTWWESWKTKTPIPAPGPQVKSVQPVANCETVVCSDIGAIINQVNWQDWENPCYWDNNGMWHHGNEGDNDPDAIDEEVSNTGSSNSGFWPKYQDYIYGGIAFVVLIAIIAIIRRRCNRKKYARLSQRDVELVRHTPGAAQPKIKLATRKDDRIEPDQTRTDGTTIV